MFIPIWGRFPIWRAYFSDGLVQPPTSDSFATVIPRPWGVDPIATWTSGKVFHCWRTDLAQAARTRSHRWGCTPRVFLGGETHGAMNKKPGCLGYIGDSQLYGDYWIPINKPVYWKVGIVFFSCLTHLFFFGGVTWCWKLTQVHSMSTVFLLTYKTG